MVLIITFSELIAYIFSLFGTLFVVCYSAPIVLAVVAPLFGIFIFIQRYYILVSRQFKRMVSITASKVNSCITETYSGATTIRAFQLEDKFIEDNGNHIEENQKYAYPEIASDSWLYSGMELISSLVRY